MAPSATAAGAPPPTSPTGSDPVARPPLCSHRPAWALSWYQEEAPLPLNLQPRYLGLDVGSKRIGVAVSNELGHTAQPVLTLERRRSTREDLRSLARLARRFSVVGIVVGNPLHLSGEPSPRALKTQALADELGKLTALPIHMWDERLTTREAHQILYETGHPRQTHRPVVDQVAATLILQSFLDQRSDQGSGVHKGSGGGDQGSEKNPLSDDGGGPVLP